MDVYVTTIYVHTNINWTQIKLRNTVCDTVSIFNLLVDYACLQSTVPLILIACWILLQTSHRLEVISAVAVTLGLVFLVLSLFTFALCRRNPRVVSVARINLCISLLLAHLLFLLTQTLNHEDQVSVISYTDQVPTYSPPLAFCERWHLPTIQRLQVMDNRQA